MTFQNIARPAQARLARNGPPPARDRRRRDAGRNRDSCAAFGHVGGRYPASPSAVDAEGILFVTRCIPGLPFIVVPVALPSAATLARQVAVAARGAARPDAHAKLVYGVMLWR